MTPTSPIHPGKNIAIQTHGRGPGRIFLQGGETPSEAVAPEKPAAPEKPEVKIEDQTEDGADGKVVFTSSQRNKWHAELPQMPPAVQSVWAKVSELPGTA